MPRPFLFLLVACAVALPLSGLPTGAAESSAANAAEASPAADPDVITPPATAPATAPAPAPASAPAVTTPPAPAVDASATTAKPADPSGDVLLRANDRLQFRIAEDPVRGSSPMALSVNSVGEVGFPISRDSDVRITLQVRGKSLAQVRDEIAKKLVEDYYRRATVELTLGEKIVTPGKVQFFGEIQTVLQLSPDGPPLKLSDAILQARVPDFANLRRVKVHRLNAVTGQTTVIEVNVDAIIKDGQRDKDIILEDGDRVEVKQKWFN